MKEHKFVVTIKIDESVKSKEVRGYINDAVSMWGGQWPKEDPFFPTNNKVKVVRFKTS